MKQERGNVFFSSVRQVLKQGSQAAGCARCRKEAHMALGGGGMRWDVAQPRGKVGAVFASQFGLQCLGRLLRRRLGISINTHMHTHTQSAFIKQGEL